MKKPLYLFVFAMLLTLMAGQSRATTITFTGVIDRADSSFGLFTVGDSFSATFHFRNNPDFEGGPISRYSIAAGDYISSGVAHRGAVIFIPDPSPAILYQVFQYISRSASSPYTGISGEIVLQTGTTNGVVPPLEDFDLNDFVFAFDVPNNPEANEGIFGHLTTFPTVANAVPDNDSTVMSLGLAILSGVLLRRRPSRCRDGRSGGPSRSPSYAAQTASFV